jgi:hypothetical protein
LKPDATCSDKTDAAILDQLELDWDREQLTSANYDRPEWNKLVEYFRDRLGSGAFTLPLGGFQTLDTLDLWSKNGYLLLTTDKGHTREENLIGRQLPTMVQHGCFSFSLNFCALAQWFKQQGGRAWLPSYYDGKIQFAAFSRNPGAQPLPAVDRAYRQGPAELSPGDFHEIVRRCERSEGDLSNCLALVRLSAHEPQVFYQLRRLIRSQLKYASETERNAVRIMLGRVAANDFHLDKEDISFAIGLTLLALGDYDTAVPYFRRSLQLFGDRSMTYYNLAICQMELLDDAEARKCVRRAIQLDSDNSDAIELAQELGVDVPAFESV